MREVPARQVRGYHTSLRWSADGQSVEKHYERNFWFLDRRCRPFEKERRIGLLLRRYPPPVRAARLLGVDRSRRVLRFEAIDGGPFGPKYPLAMAPGDLDLLIGSALAMGTYRPRACFATRFDLARRLRRAVSGGLLSGSAASRFAEVAAADPPVLVFGHGDLTARNVLRGDAGEPVLIDWEWAGRYPRGWDLAFLWYSVVDLPGGRAQVEAAVPRRDERWFWRAALLVGLLHLGMAGLASGSPFRAHHEEVRDQLVARVLDGS